MIEKLEPLERYQERPERWFAEENRDKINEIVDLVNEQTEVLTIMAEQQLNLGKEVERRDKAIMDLCTVVEKLAESKGKGVSDGKETGKEENTKED